MNMIGFSNTAAMAKLAEHLLPLKAMRLAAIPHFPLIGIGTRLPPISAIMPSYVTAITAAVR